MSNPCSDYIGQSVEVYKNLHKDKYSIRLVSTGRVIGWADTVSLENVTFRVSQAGRHRVIRTKRKNVHAVVRGTLTGAWEGEAIAIGTRVTYNPYTGPYFLIEGDERAPIHRAGIVVLTKGKVVVQRMSQTTYLTPA